MAGILALLALVSGNIVKEPHFESSMGPAIREPWFRAGDTINTLVLVAGYADLPGGMQAASFTSPTQSILDPIGTLTPAELYQNLPRTNVKKFDEDSSLAFLYRIEETRRNGLNFADVIYELENSQGNKKRLVFLDKGTDKYVFGYPRNDDFTKVIEFDANLGELVEKKENFYQILKEQFGDEIDDYDVTKIRLQNVGGRMQLGGTLGGEVLFTKLVLDTIEDTTSVSEIPKETVPTLELLSPLGSTITLRYSDCPHGFHAKIFDISGKKCDELHSNLTSGTIEWGEEFEPGVYFVRVESGASAATKKVILVR